jgi:hypothetical protein
MSKDTRSTLKLKSEVRDRLRLAKVKRNCLSYDEVILLLIEESNQYREMVKKEKDL